MPFLSPQHAAVSHPPRALATTLAWLRVCAVVGQAATTVFVAGVLHLPIDVVPLLLGIAALAAFDVVVAWRLRQAWPVTEAEVVLHLLVDTGVLCYLLYFSGGATNPFVSLYVVPIALAATALSPRYLACTVLVACMAYLSGLIWHVPLPNGMSHAMSAGSMDAPSFAFDLHVLGMAVNFAISAVLLGFFIWRLARELRLRESMVQRERERALRDEGILAIATQAAGAAHELNTPLSTIRTLATELRREYSANSALIEDLALLSSQADRCRDILRELVLVGANQLTEEADLMSLHDFIADCADRFRLLRPAIDLSIALADDENVPRLRILPALRHALINLLNNAADASQSAQSNRVEMTVQLASQLRIDVRDFGAGLPQAVREAGGLRFVSGKRDGLGLGLALANATVERLHGRLRADPANGTGTVVSLILPLSSLEEPDAALIG